jgi:hypothetical protein
MFLNTIARQAYEPATEVDLEFKAFFVNLVESACKEGLTLAQIDQEIQRIREGLLIPGMETWPLKEWATQTYWAFQNAPKAEARMEICGLCGKIAPYRELNCASFCPYLA